MPYKTFRDTDTKTQAFRLLVLGILIGLMIYSFVISFYSKERSYFYYALYLLFMLWHQSTFLGLTQIYFPKWFILLDSKLVVPKLGFILLPATLFALSFLKIKKTSWLFKIYLLFGAIAIAIIFFIRDLQLVLLIGVVYVFFNLFAGVVSYRRGVKEARLFILGFGVVSVAYLIIILDSFGITTPISYGSRNMLMIASTIEVILLNLAIADRYQILQAEKEQIVREREDVIKKEVAQKTAELDKALHAKELLLKEVHHRVKNNLQMILSIMHLQERRIKDKSTRDIFVSLENRVNAISKTYNMLILDNQIEFVDMNKYTSELVKDIKNCMYESASKINIETKIDLTLPLREAVYIGIVINELVTNAFKYAFGKDGGNIYIKLYKKNDKRKLIISDNGKGFKYNKKADSLGLKLIEMLIKEQLEGTIKMKTEPSVSYIIEF